MSNRLLTYFTYIVLFATLITVGAGTGALVLASRVRTGTWSMPTRTDLVWLADLIGYRAPEPSRVVYLNRATITIIGGDDDAHRNRSSLLDEGTQAVLPGFTGSDRAWKAVVRCVNEQFAAFDVTITETRPTKPGYTMVAVGGRPIDLGMKRPRVSGLSPFNGDPLSNTLIFAFSETHQNRVRDTCETIAHEIGHTYGLDHSYECTDVMTHLTGCGAKQFVDLPVPCGEQSQRPCHDDQPTQGTYLRLMELLGPRRNA